MALHAVAAALGPDQRLAAMAWWCRHRVCGVSEAVLWSCSRHTLFCAADSLHVALMHARALMCALLSACMLSIAFECNGCTR
jgi:hypothetical protein